MQSDPKPNATQKSNHKLHTILDQALRQKSHLIQMQQTPGNIFCVFHAAALTLELWVHKVQLFYQRTRRHCLFYFITFSAVIPTLCFMIFIQSLPWNVILLQHCLLCTTPLFLKLDIHLFLIFPSHFNSSSSPTLLYIHSLSFKVFLVFFFLSVLSHFPLCSLPLLPTPVLST